MGGLCVKGEYLMENQETGALDASALDASFDVVARQDAADQALGALRSDIEEVKSQMARAHRVASRPLIGAGGGANLETKSFVDGYLRQGREGELKSMTIGSVTDGGYAVPTELDARIAERLVPISPIRGIAQVVQTSTADYRKLISLGGTVSGWVSETAVRTGTSSPSFAEIIPPSGDLYANPSASQQMLDDAAFDLESWLAQEVATEFGRAEGAAFVNGSGTNQPKGFLATPSSNVADATRAFGTLQYLASGDAATLGTTPDRC
jgi:HK97 family phage major capsid protein